MPRYKAVLKGGHVGAGKEYDFTVYFKEKDMMSALDNVTHMGRVKGKKDATGVLDLREISREEYIIGKLKQLADPTAYHIAKNYQLFFKSKKRKHIYGH